MGTNVSVNAKAEAALELNSRHLKQLTQTNKDLVTGQRNNPASNPDKDLMGKNFAASATTIANRLDLLTQAGGVANYGYAVASELSDQMASLRSIVEKAGNPSNSADAREALAAQAEKTFESIYEITQTEFNGSKLIDGSLAGDQNVQTDTVGVGDSNSSETAKLTTSQILPSEKYTLGDLNIETTAPGTETFEYTPAKNAHYKADDLKLTFAAGTGATDAVKIKIGNQTVAIHTTGADNSGIVRTDDSITIAKNMKESDTTTNITENLAKALQETFAGHDIKVSGPATGLELTLNFNNSDVNSITGGSKAYSFVPSDNGATLASFQIGTATPDTTTKTEKDVNFEATVTAAQAELLKITAGATDKEAETLVKFLTNPNGVSAVDTNSKPITITAERVAAFSRFSASVNSTDTKKIDLVSRKEGETTKFIDSAGNSSFAVFDASAKGGSLASSNIIAAGSVSSGSIVKPISGSYASSASTAIDMALIADGATVAVGGRTFTFRENVKDPVTEIKLPAGNSAKALENMVNTLNDSTDPAISGFKFTLYTRSSGGSIIKEIQMGSQGQSEAVNGQSLVISNGAMTPATIKLSGGASSGIDTSAVTSNKDFYGTIQGFTVSPEGSEFLVKIKVGDYTYSSKIQNLNLSNDKTLYMSSSDERGGYFILNLAANPKDETGNLILAGKEGAELRDAFATALDKAFSGIIFKQKREISSFQPESGSKLDGTMAELVSKKFTDDLNIASVTVDVATASKGAVLTMQDSMGRVYKSGATDIGQSLFVGSTIKLVQEGVNSANADAIILTFSSEFDMSNADVTALLQKNLSHAFKAGSSPLKVQVGNNSYLDIKIPDLSFKTLFGTDDIKDPNLDVSTVDGANAVLELITTAQSQALLQTGKLAATLASVESTARTLEAQKSSVSDMRDLYLNQDRQKSAELYAEIQNMIDLDLYGLSQNRMINQKLIQNITRG